jgi:hypothetical protein
MSFTFDENKHDREKYFDKSKHLKSCTPSKRSKMSQSKIPTRSGLALLDNALDFARVLSKWTVAPLFELEHGPAFIHPQVEERVEITTACPFSDSLETLGVGNAVAVDLIVLA